MSRDVDIPPEIVNTLGGLNVPDDAETVIVSPTCKAFNAFLRFVDNVFCDCPPTTCCLMYICGLLVVLSVGFVGWIPLMLVLQYFSIAYLLYSFVFKVLTKIPGFSYVQLMYFEVIAIFPIIDVVLITVNPFYN